MAGILGLALPAPERAAVDHGAINAVLVVLVVASAASIEMGASARLRSSLGRLALVLVISTAVLAASAWAVSHLVTDDVLRHGVLALGVAPAEIATLALTTFAGGDAAVAAALLVSSTTVTVIIAGPVLALEAGGSVSTVHVLVSLLLVVGVPMLVGLAARRRVHRSTFLTNAVGPVSTIAVVVLVALVASQVHLARAYVGVTVALVGFIAASTVAGAAAGRLVAARDGTAVVLSTSVRDFAIASGIATAAFGAASAAPLGLYGVLVIGWGALLARARARRTPLPT